MVKLHSLETQFALLDELPDCLYLPVVTHTHGELLKRIEGILQWRSALLAGQLPQENALVWPEKSVARTVLMRLEALDMVQYCQEQAALTDSVLESILDAVSSAEDQANKHGEAGIFNDELAQRQKQRDRDSIFEDKEAHQPSQSSTETQPQCNTEAQPSSQSNASDDQLKSPAEQSVQENNTLETEHSTQHDKTQGLEPVEQTAKPNDNNTIQQEYSKNAIAPSENVFNQDNLTAENLETEVGTDDRAIQDLSFNNELLQYSNNDSDVPEDLNHNTQALSTQCLEDLDNDSDTPEDLNHSHQDSSKYPLGDVDHKRELSHTAGQSFAIADYAAEHLAQEWQDLAQTWHELSAHYEGLSQHLGLGWDLTQGVLASDGWRNIIQHRKRIKHSPYLQKLVAALGRLREYDVNEDTESFTETVMTAIKRQQEQREEITTPYAINDTGGIKRGDDIARMLPSELSLLGHPQLKRLWHVKRAERTLLSYQLQGLSAQIDQSEQETIEENPEENPSPEKGHGPIIICLDTSASMQGEPEQIAKALVLETLRIAADEERACYVYSFGGEKQVLEHELNLSQGGLSQLLNFLQQSFTGGTDVSYALRKALHKQTEVAWKNADILLISDGRFPVDQGLEHKISTIKKRSDLRIHGVLLGRWRGQAIQNICEPLHRFADIISET